MNARKAGRNCFPNMSCFMWPTPLGPLHSAPMLNFPRKRYKFNFASVLTPPGKPAEQQVRFKDQRELPLAAEGMEPPYDIDVRYRRKRDQTQWVGYIVHVSETCDLDEPHLLTHVHTQKRRFMKPCAPVADPIPHLFDLIRPYSIDRQIMFRA
jgi:hypothetical protein